MKAIRKTAVAGLLAGTALALPAPALAQFTPPPSPPPIRETIDGNGVDLGRGTVVSRAHSVSIGGPGNLGLGWSREITSSGGARDSSNGWIVSGNGVTVAVGGGSETFTLTGGNYVSVEKTGSTLTNGVGGFVYTTAGGTRYTFEIPADDSTFGAQQQISTITQPTGEVQTYHYQVVDGVCFYKPADHCVSQYSVSRLSSITSSNGYQLHFDYFRPSDPINQTMTTDWYRLAKVTALNMSVDRCPDVSITCSYSQTWPSLTLNGVASVTDTMGRTTSYSYTSGKLTGVKRPGAAVNNVTYAYTGGFVTQAVNEGVSTGYTYVDDISIRTTTISDAVAGDRVVKTDLGTMLVTSDTNEVGKTSAYEYYPTSGLLKKVTAPELNTATYEYDARGNATKVTLTPKPGSPLAPIVTTATYPASDATQPWRCATATPIVTCNKPLTTTDAKGNVTNYAYDPVTGGATAVTRPAASVGAVRPETRYTYTGGFFGQYKTSGGTLANFPAPLTRLTATSACQTLASCAGTADETKTTIAYGGANVLPTSVSSGSGDGALTTTSAFTYDTVGNRTTVDGPLPGAADTARMIYDADREPVGAIGPDPDGAGALKYRAVRTTYNADGQVTKQERGTTNGQTDADWSAFVSLQAVDTTYDANARPVTAKLTAGVNTYALSQTSYDALGRVDCTVTRMNSARFGMTQPAACTLDVAGTAGPDRITKLTYDAADRPTVATVAFMTADQADEATVTYTDNGKVTTLKDALNNLTTTEYDGFDRVAKSRYPLPTQGANASSTTDYEAPSYDANSNVTSVRLRDGQIVALTYDNLNRATLKDLPGAEPDVTYAYDNLGRLTSASQAGNALSFTYDALSRNLTQVGPQGTVASQYDLAGRRTRLTYPGSGLYVDYDYLVTGDTTKIRENGATSGVGVLATYAHDDLGQQTGVTFGNGATQAFAYDPVSRMASLTNNLTGTTNDLTATFAYNPAAQITSTGRAGDTYAWTGHFNQSDASTANGLNQLLNVGAKAVTHDTRGNVTAIGTRAFGYSSENLLLTGPNATTLSYDPGMRLQTVASGGTTTKFAYDGMDRIAEYDAASTLQRRYVHGPGTDNPIVWYEGSGTTDRRFLSSDERGSVVSVADSAGAVLAINRYDEYGEPQATNLGMFGYTGQIRLPTVGLWYYKNRNYDSGSGRFMQTDPIGVAGGVNLYAYVENDPVNFVDSTGTVCTIINHSESWYKVFTDGHLEYLGPVSGSGWVETIGDCGGGGGRAGGSISGGGRGSGGGSRPVPEMAKPINRCLANFLNSVEPAIAWDAVRITKGGNVPGNYTTWSSEEIAVPASVFEHPSNFVLFHEFGHIYAYAMNRLSLFSYVGQAITAPFKHPLTPFNQLHDTLEAESFANDFRKDLIAKYNKAGKPCGKI